MKILLENTLLKKTRYTLRKSAKVQKCKSGVEWVGSGVEFHFLFRATRDWKSESVTD